MTCPHCSVPHALQPHDDCPACGDGLGQMCRDCGNHFFVVVEGKDGHVRCEDCARDWAAFVAKEKRRLDEEGRGDWMRDQNR